MMTNKLKLDLNALEIDSFVMPMPEMDADGTIVANSDPITLALWLAIKAAEAAAAAAEALEKLQS